MKRSLLLLTAMLVAVALPARAAGAPKVTCVMGYGVGNGSGAYCAPDYVGTVTPMGQPDGRYTPGLLWVQGYATPDSYIKITASNPNAPSVPGDPTSISVIVTSSHDISGPGGDPIGTFFARFSATRLGVHTVAPGADPTGATDDQLGRSVLNLSAVVSDAAGAPLSPAATNTFVKLAGTRHDVTAPTLKKAVIDWVAATPNRCGPWAHHHLAWAAWNFGLSFNNNHLQNWLDPILVPGNPPKVYPCTEPRLEISGDVRDDGSGANGYGSEIADIHVVITQGNTVVQDLHPFYQDWADNGNAGPRARYLVRWPLRAFAPTLACPPFDGRNFQPAALRVGPAYSMSVTITDAWGRTAPAQTASKDVLADYCASYP